MVRAYHCDSLEAGNGLARKGIVTCALHCKVEVVGVSGIFPSTIAPQDGRVCGSLFGEEGA